MATVSRYLPSACARESNAAIPPDSGLGCLLPGWRFGRSRNGGLRFAQARDQAAQSVADLAGAEEKRDARRYRRRLEGETYGRYPSVLVDVAHDQFDRT